MSSLPVIGQCLENNFDLFCCWKNPGICLGTFFCFCNTAGHVAAKKGKNCCLYGFASLIPIVSCYTRGDVRKGIKGHPLWQNFLLHCLCGPCALCQEGREVSSCQDLMKVTECCKSGQQVMK